ncbi:MAG: acyltransferase [Holophaga sp.]|jgi:peptidoglycan/LPS O-acetylase OafA/YrhL
MKKIQSLDGIRGIAILSVMAFHVSPKAAIAKSFFPNNVKLFFNILIYPISNLGWAGVDLFFVLSGFLITGILIDSKSKNRYFTNFYARRFLRIFPIYYLLLAALLFVGPMFFHSMQSYDCVRQQAYFWSYLQNWQETFRSTTGFQSSFLGTFWSLAIEEQFYLFWPLVVYCLPLRTLARLAVGCMIFSCLLRVLVNVGHSGMDAYNLVHFNLFTRFDALAFGALVAIVSRQRPEAFTKFARSTGINRLSLALGLAFALVIAIGPDDPQIGNTVFRVLGYTLLAALSAVVIIKAVAGKENGLLVRLLNSRFLVYTGAISYGLYVYHWPIYFFLLQGLKQMWSERHHAMGLAAFPFVAVGLTFLVAHVSYRFLEAPILRLKRHFETAAGAEADSRQGATAPGPRAEADLPRETDKAS